MENKIVVERAGRLSASEIIKYRWRIEKFLEKCEEGGEVEIRDTGEKVRIEPKSSTTLNTANALRHYLEGISGAFRGSYLVGIRTESGEFKIIPISALAKTAEFGGGAGIAGGSEQTAIIEAGQCVKCAELGEGTALIGKGETVESIKTQMGTLDKTWQEVLNAVGTKLTEELKGGYWHYQDTFVQSISAVYVKLKDKLPGKFDRYNPADIWWTDKPYESVYRLKEDKVYIDSLADLTEVLNDAFNNKKAIGISLKKTISPTLEKYTEEKRNTKFNLTNVRVQKRNPNTLYINILFELNNEETHIVQIRKDGATGYRATIKAAGKNQKHYDGSVGRGLILKCLQKAYPNKDIEFCDPKYWVKEREKEIEQYVLNNQEKFNEEDITAAEEILEGVYPINLTKAPELFDKDKISETDQAIADALDNIVALLKSGGKNEQKEFLGRLVRYAWSIHTDSCNFLKVH